MKRDFMCIHYPGVRVLFLSCVFNYREIIANSCTCRCCHCRNDLRIMTYMKCPFCNKDAILTPLYFKLKIMYKF